MLNVFIFLNLLQHLYITISLNPKAKVKRLQQLMQISAREKQN